MSLDFLEILGRRKKIKYHKVGSGQIWPPHLWHAYVAFVAQCCVACIALGGNRPLCIPGARKPKAVWMVDRAEISDFGVGVWLIVHYERVSIGLMWAKILSYHDEHEQQPQPLRILALASGNSRSGTPEQLTHTLTSSGTNTPVPQVPALQAAGGQERRPEQPDFPERNRNFNSVSLWITVMETLSS